MTGRRKMMMNRGNGRPTWISKGLLLFFLSLALMSTIPLATGAQVTPEGVAGCDEREGCEAMAQGVYDHLVAAGTHNPVQAAFVAGRAYALCIAFFC